MSVKKILRVWDENGLIEKNINFLKQPTKNIYFPITESTESIIQDLIDTYQKVPCAGIAANQIGYNKSIFIGMKEIDETVDTEEIENNEAVSEHCEKDHNDNADNYDIYINPQIDHLNDKSIQSETEGCLSIPLLTLQVNRYDKIRIRYYNTDGEAVKKSLSGFLSKLFQHELDHLNGILMINRDVIEGYIEKESFITADLYESLQDKFL